MNIHNLMRLKKGTTMRILFQKERITFEMIKIN